MASRIFSTILLWVIILGSLWFFGEHAAIVLLTLATTLTLHEFYQLIEKIGYRPFRWLGLTLSVAMTAGSFYYDNYSATNALPEALLVFGLLISFFAALGARETSARVEAICFTMMGLVAISFTLQYLIRILTLDTGAVGGLGLCLWVVATSKFCDVGALLTGMAIGKHKMSPSISAKKTWEGAVGGVLVSSGIGASIAFFASAYLPEFLTPLTAAIIAVPLAITTIVSDLIESAIKRRADSKDAGKLIPGIGGAFDLTDSLLLTAPVAFYVFSFLV